MCLCGCEKGGQTLFERIHNHTHRHTHMTYQTGNNDGHNHSVQAVIDPRESLRIVCEEIEEDQRLVGEELLKMKGHITQLTKYLVDQDVKGELIKKYVDEETVNLLTEARDEIKKLRSQAGFLSEDDMKLK